jgi:hypothetical protein
MSGPKPTYDQQALENNKLKMRTRGTTGQNTTLESCTEFTLHVTQQNFSSSKKRNLIDYSACRLKRYIDTVNDPQQKMVLVALLHDYKKGDVAIAWRRGQPVYVKVTKE